MDSELKTSDRDDDGSQLSDPPPTASSSLGSDGDGEQQPTEWLATTRQRRSTAGNRMKTLMANEEPDSDLELLFAEDDDDADFSDAGDDGSDVRMDSSGDDGDDDDDDLEGERELERQARDRLAAQRKRAARAAIPAKFRKRVRIGPATTPVDAATPAAAAARPRKKSERASWLPSPADLPTRASSRHTTRVSKEQLHQQMAEREARRLRQLALMEHKAARLEAARKPPMTQQQRLAEAAVVEKRNSKSLNRWEEAEKQRDEERRAKLAALNNRTLKGPVITFWSGVRQWKDALGQHVTVVEANPKKKRDAAAALAAKSDESAVSVSASLAPTPDVDSIRAPPDAAPPTASNAAGNQASATVSETEAPRAVPPLPRPPSSAPSSGLAAPAPPPQSSSPLATPLPMSRPQDPRPSGVLAAPVLAPPPGLDADGPRPINGPKSNVLAPPSIQSAPPERPAAAAATAEPGSKYAACEARFQPILAQDEAAKPASPGASEAPPRARSSTTARNAIIYRNFDHHAIRDKSLQTQILFGRKMSRLSKPAPAPLCVITNHPARYRDPKTCLPYYNAFAYGEIQRLHRGDYRWSRLLGAWVGTGALAARGVPHRFLHPEPDAERRRRLEEKAARQRQARSDAERTAAEPEQTAPRETAPGDEAKMDPKAAAAEAHAARGGVQPQQAAVAAQ